MGDVEDEYHIRNYNDIINRTHNKNAIQAINDLIMEVQEKYLINSVN